MAPRKIVETPICMISYLSLEVLVNVVEASDIGRSVADHQLGQASSEVIDDSLRRLLRGDVTLYTHSTDQIRSDQTSSDQIRSDQVRSD